MPTFLDPYVLYARTDTDPLFAPIYNGLQNFNGTAVAD